MSKIVRVAGTQGFYGDSPMGALAVAAEGAADYLMHDALAELTLSILQKDRQADPTLGYARDIELHAKILYPMALANGMKIVTDSGGLNPHSAAQKVKSILARSGITNVKIAAIDGDDLFDQIDNMLAAGLELRNLDTNEPYPSNPTFARTHANAYIGAAKIKQALDEGAQIILAGRVADPCLMLGILAHEFGWNISGDQLTQTDLDRMANAIMVGHILECGGQASGGNSYAEWPMPYSVSNLGYPIAHVHSDGSATITKLDSAGGKVSRNTIREQLVYEIHDPANYITPDVIVDLTHIQVQQLAPNQVHVSGAKGKPRPQLLKLCIGQMEGFLTEQLFFFSWPYAYQKAQKFAEACQEIWANLPTEYSRIEINYLGINGIHPHVAPTLPTTLTDQLNEVGVRLALRHTDQAAGKMALQSIICLGLNGPPGICASPAWGKPSRALLSLWPTLIPRSWVQERLTIY